MTPRWLGHSLFFLLPALVASPVTLREAAAPRGVLIGAAVSSRHLDDANYTRLIASEFSQLEPENEMKFGLIHPRPSTDPQPFNFGPADALVTFAQAHHLVVRGHTLVWHEQVPPWVSKGEFTSDQLASILHDHISTEVGHFGTQVYAWDVVNEGFNKDGTLRSTLWYDQPGIGFAGQGTKYIEQALEWAHAANPQAKLFYNDYETETENPKSDAVYAMASDFKKRGVPLAGIGFQAHLTLDFDDPEKLKSFADNLRRFSALGLELHITELDVRVKDSNPATLNAEAHLYGEIAGICVQNPSCKVIQTWGVTDKYSWIPGFFKGYGWGLLFDDNYQKKPAYSSLLNALMKTPKQ